MYAQSDTTQDRPAAVRSATPWRVRTVTPLPDYQLAVTFQDGSHGTVDLSERIHAAHAGVFAELADVRLFDQVEVVFGAVTWPNGIDLAPDAMHRAIKAGGKWVLR